MILLGISFFFLLGAVRVLGFALTRSRAGILFWGVFLGGFLVDRHLSTIRQEG